jgi:hypothetical protein
MNLMTKMVLSIPLAPLDLMKQVIVGMRPDKTEDAFYAERRFIKSNFYTGLRVALRNRRHTSVRPARAWARGYLKNEAAFNAAAADGLVGFTERLLAANPDVHPLVLCFGMDEKAAKTWFEATLSRVMNGSHVLGEAFVQTVAEFNIPYDYFERLYEVHEEAKSGYNAQAFLSRLSTDTMRKILAQLGMVRGPRRDSLAWASLCETGPHGFERDDLIEALPFLVAAGCSPAEATRLRGIGVTDPRVAARIVADNVPDEYVYTMVQPKRMGLVGV